MSSNKQCDSRNRDFPLSFLHSWRHQTGAGRFSLKCHPPHYSSRALPHKKSVITNAIFKVGQVDKCMQLQILSDFQADYAHIFPPSFALLHHLIALFSANKQKKSRPLTSCLSVCSASFMEFVLAVFSALLHFFSSFILKEQRGKQEENRSKNAKKREKSAERDTRSFLHRRSVEKSSPGKYIHWRYLLAEQKRDRETKLSSLQILLPKYFSTLVPIGGRKRINVRY